MLKKIALASIVTLVTGCASITPEDVKQNAHYTAKVELPLNLSESSLLTEEVMKVCYPNIGFSMVPGGPGALEVYKVEGGEGKFNQYVMGNVTYGGILVIDIYGKDFGTSIELTGKDNGWNRHFNSIVSMLKNQQTSECRT